MKKIFLLCFGLLVGMSWLHAMDASQGEETVVVKQPYVIYQRLYQACLNTAFKFFGQGFNSHFKSVLCKPIGHDPEHAHSGMPLLIALSGKSRGKKLFYVIQDLDKLFLHQDGNDYMVVQNAKFEVDFVPVTSEIHRKDKCCAAAAGAYLTILCSMTYGCIIDAILTDRAKGGKDWDGSVEYPIAKDDIYKRLENHATIALALNSFFAELRKVA